MAKAEQRSRKTPETQAAEPPRTGILSRLAGLPRWMRSHPRLAAITIAGVTVAIIGGIGGLALVFRPATQPAYMRQLSQAFAEFDKGNRKAARQIAAKLLTDTTVGYAEHGGAYYILGALTLGDADEQINLTKRQLLDLVAARYLEEARSRGLPPERQQEGIWLLGRALHDAGRYSRCIAILRESLELQSQSHPQIHTLLADSFLSLQPPRLEEALAHNRLFLDSPGLSPLDHDAGRLVEGRILLARKETAEAEKSVEQIQNTSAAYPEAVVLKGRILVESLTTSGAQSPAMTAAIAAMRDQLKTLLDREALPPSISAQAQLLIGMLEERAGDPRAAMTHFDRIRRVFFGQPESLAATIFHGDLVRPDNPHEAVALYKRALSQVGDAETAYNNLWLPADEFRSRLSTAIDDLAESSHFAEALDLTEALVAPFNTTVAIERQANIHRAWARQLEERARGERLPQLSVIEAECWQHWRRAGGLWRRLAELRIATRSYLDDLASAADDLRRGHGYEQAAVVYRELLQQRPQQGEPEALVGLGETLLALGKTEEALAMLARCHESFPHHPSSYQARLLSSFGLQEQDKLTEAQELLIDNLYHFSLTPQSTEWCDSIFALGALLYKQALTLEGRSRLAGVDRPNAESRRLGLQLLEQSHAAFEEAIRTLQEAVQRYPNAPQASEARYRIAEAYRHSAKLPRKRLAGVTIETSKAALIRQMQEQLQTAIDEYSRLITRFSDEQDAQRGLTEAAILRNCYFGRADALFDLARYDEAIEAYSGATNRYQHDPESLEAYVQIASCYRRLGRVGEARGTLEQARVVLQRIGPEADFLRTTRLGRQDWQYLLDWLRTL